MPQGPAICADRRWHASAGAVGQDAFGANVSCYRDSDPGAGEPRHIHPFDYMARTQDHDPLRSVCRVALAYDQGAVDALVDEVPAEHRVRVLMGDGMRASHKALLAERFERSLVPVAERARMLLG